MRKPLLVATICAVSFPLLAPSVRAEEASVYDQAFQSRRRSELASGAMTLSTAGVASVAAYAADEAVAESADKLRRERQRIARILSTQLPQHRVHIEKELELELLKDKPALSLTKQDKVRMQSLRGEIAAYPGRAVVARERALTLRDMEDLETGRTFLQNDKTAVRTTKLIRAGAILASVGLAIRGSYALIHGLWEKDPGYSPAVNLSRTESKQAAASQAPRTEPSADTSFSAE